MFENKDPSIPEKQASPDNERTNQSEDQVESKNVTPDVDNTLLTLESTGSDASSAPQASNQLTRMPKWLYILDYRPSS